MYDTLCILVNISVKNENGYDKKIADFRYVRWLSALVLSQRI